jgi:hypothetical protein
MMGRPLTPPLDRLRSKTIYPPSGCWIWTGPLNRPGGYGRVAVGGGRMGLAHRVAYELLVGPIPEGKQLDHLCRNRACWNPEHLEVVTGKENTLRGIGRTAANAAKTHCNRGHELAGDNLYVYDGQRKCRACKRETIKAWRKQAAETLESSSIPHGLWRYGLGCRCDECRTAKADYGRSRRAASQDPAPADGDSTRRASAPSEPSQKVEP